MFLPSNRIGLPLGALECQEDPAAHFERIVQVLDARSQRLPVRSPEVRVAGARGDGQVVERDDTPVGEGDRPGRTIDRSGLAEQDLDVPGAAKDRPDRRCDVARRQRRRRDLVQHRLEQMVIGAIDQGHVDGAARQLLGEIETREPAPQDHHTRATHSRIVSRRQRANRTMSLTGGTASSLP